MKQTPSPDRGSVKSELEVPNCLPGRVRHDLGMLRLQNVGCARKAAIYRLTRHVTARSHSTHNHGHSQSCNHDHGHSHPHPHEHHPVHTQSGTPTRPASASPPLDPTVFGPASEACKNLVFKRDYESFLTSKFYPNDAQDGFFALKAFYVYTLPLLSPLHS